MRGWTHSGFSVDQSVYLPAGDRAGIERLTQYMTRCPFSLSRLVRVTATGQVVYKAEKDACRRFPDPRGNELASGPKRNFQVLDPLDFLAEFTQHIPPKGAHLIRYYGWYSNKSRGMRRKAAEKGDCPPLPERPEGCLAQRGTVPFFPPPVSTPSRCSQTWAMLIKRVYEVDPLACPKCGGVMRVVAFIEPPQGALIERILRHCGLWHPSTPRPPPAGDCPDFCVSKNGTVPFDSTDWSDPVDFSASGFSPSAASSSKPDDWTYVDIDTFEANVDEFAVIDEFEPAF